VAKDNVPICSRDGFPKVKIDGRWTCVAEYLDRCIGGQRITDLIERGGTVYYVFENGHELPMLCFCCDRPLVYRHLKRSRRRTVGRRLESMSVGPVEKDGRILSQFCLELSKKGIFSRPVAVPVSAQVAVQMKHPPGCPRGRGGSATDRPAKKRRHKKR
jgi:hypothetical protein